MSSELATAKLLSDLNNNSFGVKYRVAFRLYWGLTVSGTAGYSRNSRFLGCGTPLIKKVLRMSTVGGSGVLTGICHTL